MRNQSNNNGVSHLCLTKLQLWFFTNHSTSKYIKQKENKNILHYYKVTNFEAK